MRSSSLTRRKASPRLQIKLGPLPSELDTPSETSTPSYDAWYRPELQEEDIPLNLGAETSWDGTKRVGVAQGRQRSNTVVGAVFAPGIAPSVSASMLQLNLGPIAGVAEEPLQPPVHLDGASSAYGNALPMGAEFDDELTRRLLREKRQLKEEGRWVDDGDIESIVSRRRVSDDQGEIGSNLLCNLCFQKLGDMCFTRCRHIFCQQDVEEHVIRTLEPDTHELACPACGTSCTYGRDVISVSTGRPAPLPLGADPRPSASGAQLFQLPVDRSVARRSIDQSKQSKTPQLPSPPITPAPSLPISLYDQRASSLYMEKPRPLDVRTGIVGAIEKAVEEQFSRVLSIVALALVLWVLVK